MVPDEEREVRDLLTSWGVKTNIIDKFIDNDMDIFSLKHMDESSYNELLPSHGVRIKFKAHREEWMKSKKVEAETGEGSESSGGDQRPEQSKLIAAMDLNGNLSLQFPANFMEEDNDGDVGGASREEARSTSPLVVVDVLKEIEENDARVVTVTQSIPPPAKKSKTNHLEKVLQTVSKGRRVLSLYAKEKQFSKDSIRDELVEAVLDNETSEDLGKVLPRERLKFLAQQIVQLFPKEEEGTYFESYVHPKTGKVCARGKLVWRYYNRRRDFVKCGAIEKLKKATKTVESNASSNVTSTSLKDVVIDTTTKGSLFWLEQNRGIKNNWDEVLVHWKSTSKARLKILLFSEMDASEVDTFEVEAASTSQGKKGKKTKNLKELERIVMEKTAHDYLSKYPAFLENSGVQLFEIDFKTLHPDVDPLSLFAEWTTLSKFVIQQVQKKNPDFMTDPTLTAGEKNILILRNLSKLFPVVTVSGNKKGKKTWRPSHAEVADAFILIASSTLQFEEDKDKKREALMKLRLHMQPFVTIVGDIENPLQFLVCVDEFFYETDSVLSAVDQVFKTFFALHTPYPAEAEQVWLFLQTVVYGFSTDEDAFYSGVRNMVKDYKEFKANLSRD